ncbi:uncharacterized protein PFL1_03959 [Pseudozyma flocculosa PF-1]|uniref:CoA-binding domain-containing protein n=2 Tax=Pseudozyma flocculosa TaxID=84751 RepID=A0A5C3EX09_9BASI|nr:uncharacterized protein PFL1_03959 [Pseudozyma flocculosa PF-1]EPQ28656.1 hypothetical protein PFL1_03959 [Pseudozyma flocculosa PF-1]SPO36602.1 uncharacterized protein PSFLO_02073 [Pseudozyma flocculosa]
MSHVQTALGRFFESSSYAVVGASKDPSKFGNKVLKWYQAHKIPATPIHPKEPEIEGLPTSANVADLVQKLKAEGKIESEAQLSLSIVTPPKISLGVVQDGINSGVGAFWLQPGAEDAELVSWVRSQSEQVQEKIIYGGPCILISGAQLASAKGRL